MEKKCCSKCKKSKELKFFGIKRYNKDGLNHYCKKCENERSKLKYSEPENKERIKYNTIFRLYGLRKEEYFRKLEKQNFKCEICYKPLLNDKNTHIDHSHQTGKVRDILCSTCNYLLGIVNDDTNKLKSYISYLDKHAEIRDTL